MSDTDAARIGDVKAGFDAVKADTSGRARETAPVIVVADTELQAGQRIAVSTVLGAIVATLPEDPESIQAQLTSARLTIRLEDVGNSFGVNSLTIARNGHLINGLGDDLTLDQPGSIATIVWVGGSVGWSIVTTLSREAMDGRYAFAEGAPTTLLRRADFGEGQVGAALAAILETPGDYTLSPGWWDIGDTPGIQLFDGTSLTIPKGSVVHQPQAGTTCGFWVGESITDVRIYVNGELIGPAKDRDPDPSTQGAYPFISTGIRMLARPRYRSTITIRGDGDIWGWDAMGALLEHGVNCQASVSVRKCGIAGIQTHGDLNGRYPSRVQNIYPGRDGVAPNRNVYGIEFSRLPETANLFSFPEDLTNAVWTKTNVTASAGVNEPYAGANIGGFKETTANGQHQVSRDSTRDPNDTTFFAVFAEPDGRNVLRLTMTDAGSPLNYARVHFNVSTGTVVAQGVGGSGHLIDAGIEAADVPGRWRCWMVARPNPGSTANTRFIAQVLDNPSVPLVAGGVYVGDVTKGLKLSGIQSSPSSKVIDYGTNVVVFPRSVGSSARGCWVRNCPSWKGVGTHGGIDIDFNDVDIEGCYVGVGIDGHTDLVTGNISVSGRIKGYDGSASAVWVYNRPDTTLNQPGGYDVNIDNLTIEDVGLASYGGIVVSNHRNTTIGAGVRMKGVKACGVVLRDKVKNAKIGAVVMDIVEDGGIATGVRSIGADIDAEVVPIRSNGTTVDYNLTGNGRVLGGRYTTAGRPTPPANAAGYWYFDTTLNKPLYWDGTAYRDATGTVI